MHRLSRKKELIIAALPNTHNKLFKFKTNLPAIVALSTTTTPSDTPIDHLESEARRALVLEAQKANEAWNDRNENGIARVHTIELASGNTFTNTLENGDAPSEENQEEKEIENADYNQVPIEEFGLAVLRGMGWKDNSGLGISNKKQVDVFVPQSRPRGLGLGASPEILEKINKLKRNAKKSGIDEKDDLCYEKGAFVKVENGIHKGLYGTIESIDEDTARLTITLTVGGGTNKKKEPISISQYNVKLVTETEYIKRSRYVNSDKAEKVEKETADKLMKDYRHSDYDDHKRHRPSSSSRHENGHDNDRKHRHHHDESSRSRKR